MIKDIGILQNNVKELLSHSIEELKVFCGFSSISSHQKMIPETVKYLQTFIESIGGSVRILDDLDKSNPFIYAYFTAGENGNSDKTLLFYNHYDVQPAEPLNEWNTKPFELIEMEGKLFARGVADNKGDIMARLTACKVLKETEAGLPCNLKFIIEGEEEIGSPNLPYYLQKYSDLFAADACVWEHADKDEKDRVNLMAGVKGMAYFELSCKSANIDLHSKLGAVVENAAWRLTHALSTMKNHKHEITVDGFYKGITPPTELEMEYVKKMPFDSNALTELYGLKQSLITTYNEQDPREALIFNPTMTICGFESGYYGEGAKTVLPKKALAKLDCRLVPGQDPNQILQYIKAHLEKYGYSDIKVKLLNGVKAYRSDLYHPFVSLMVRTAKEVYCTEVVLAPNNAGTGPMSDFGHILSLPIVSTGVGWFHSQLHAPNESIRVKDYEEGIVHIAYLIQEFAKEN